MEIKAKVPGPTISITDVNLHFGYNDFARNAAATTGYERLLYDAMIGEATHFHRAHIVEASWRIATPVLDLWSSLPARDFPNYSAGSWGPSAADALLSRDGRSWYNVGI
jgi:glucose-6-phosphate 1-dehydrogenase